LKFFITFFYYFVPYFRLRFSSHTSQFSSLKDESGRDPNSDPGLHFLRFKANFFSIRALPFTQSANDEGAWLNKGNPVPCVFHGPHTKTSKAAAVANETLLLRRYCDGIKPHDARRARSVCLI